MADIVVELEDLKKTVNDVLIRYGVPLDDRSLVIDKIQEAMTGVLGTQKQAFTQKLGEIKAEIDGERNKVINEVEGMRAAALHEFSDIHSKIRNAYEEGLSDGAASTPSQSGPGVLNISLGVILVALAAIFVVGGIVSKKN